MYDFRGADSEAAEKAADDQREFEAHVYRVYCVRTLFFGRECLRREPPCARLSSASGLGGGLRLFSTQHVCGFSGCCLSICYVYDLIFILYVSTPLPGLK
jgi:hypothetical protein